MSKDDATSGSYPAISSNEISRAKRCWAIVPAAGVGRRMNCDRPKQYLPLAGKTVIEHALHRLARHPRVDGIVVVIGADDPYWNRLDVRIDKPLRLAAGGNERYQSVLNGLLSLAEHLNDFDWVMVHDAARPCLNRQDIDRLFSALWDDSVGGLLAAPVIDTIKRSTPQNTRSMTTVDRDRLWQAFTPQMFRFKTLIDALKAAIEQRQTITDEASAIEWAGFRPRLIHGRADNIKITRAEDLRLAEFFLEHC